MIPQNLHWAFEGGHRVQTLAGVGRMKCHRLADLTLPSGIVSMGYPGDGFSNEPNSYQPQVPPGTYPVFINVVRNKGAAGAFAFVGVKFTNTDTVTWERSGQFFTDRGDGCIFDASVIELFRARKSQMSREEWGELKTAALHDGDGNLILDQETGANAVVFRAGDWSYNCFGGRDIHGQISCLVVDGRVQQRHDGLFKSLVDLLSSKVKH